jgi:Domain of unknown function (DUF4389)
VSIDETSSSDAPPPEEGAARGDAPLPPAVPPPITQPGASAALPPAAPTALTPPPVEPPAVPPPPPAAYARPADEPPPPAPDQPIQMSVPADPGQSRLWGIPFLGIWVRALLLIPVAIELFFLFLAVSILFLVSWIPVLVQGRQAPFITQIVGGTLRLSSRAALYALLATGSYPWFGIGNEHPITVTYDEYEPQNRLWGIPVLGIAARAILLIPHFFVLWILGIIAAFVVLVSWIPVLISGRQAEPIVTYLAGVYRWGVRVSAYATLLTGTYPPFRLSN